MISSTVATLLVLGVIGSAIGAPYLKREKRGASAAAEATQAVADLVNAVSGTLTSGSSNVAMVRWAGNLVPTVDLAHGKTIINDEDSKGGIVAVMKRDCALIGAEANVVLTANGQQVGKVYLATFYSGAQPTAILVTGTGNFQQQTVTENGSTALVLAYITPNDSYEVSSENVPYSDVSGSSESYNAASGSIQS